MSLSIGIDPVLSGALAILTAAGDGCVMRNRLVTAHDESPVNTLREDGAIACRRDYSSGGIALTVDHCVLAAAELSRLVHAIGNVACRARTPYRPALGAIGERNRPLTDAPRERKRRNYYPSHVPLLSAAGLRRAEYIDSGAPI